MLSLHTNAASLSTQNSLSVNNKNLTSSMTKLGTGFRVNSAMDDAAGLQIATRLNAQSRGMQVAQKNTQNGISMLQTAEGSMSEINNMLLRMKDLATEAANGTATADDRAALQAEFGALGKEISNILKNTTFAGSTLFSADGSIGKAGALSTGGSIGDAAGITFQVGATAAEKIEMKAGADDGSLKKLMTALQTVSNQIGATVSKTDDQLATLANLTKPTDYDSAKNTMTAELAKIEYSELTSDQKKTLNGDTNEISEDEHTKALAKFNYDQELANFKTAYNGSGAELFTGSSANSIITTLNTAINAVGTFRSDLGAVANRLDHTYNNLSNMITNTEAAKGRIMDVDYATETSNMTKNQMLMQASSAMLKQSNSMSQMVSSLLQ